MNPKKELLWSLRVVTCYHHEDCLIIYVTVTRNGIMY